MYTQALPASSHLPLNLAEERGARESLVSLYDVEKPPSLSRKLAELLTYIPMIIAAYVSQLGIIQIKFAGGGVQMVCGALLLAVIVLSGGRFTMSIWFAALFNLLATISQTIGQGELPLVGGGLPGLAFWFFNLLGVCYVVQNRAAERRMIIFFVIFLVILTLTGGYLMKTHKVLRLGLEGVGGAMANPNTIAYIGGLFSVALMFWSLRCKIALRPILWILALVMFVLLLRTLSRTGLVLFAAGFSCFLIAVFAGKGMRISGLLFLVFAVLAASQITYILADFLMFFEKRLELRTAEGRLGIYQMQTLYDLAGTLLFGKGPDEAQLTGTGINAHNTFVYIHMAWGGITAYAYTLWLIFLGARIYRMARAPEMPIDIKMQVIAYFLMFMGGELSNNVNFYTYSSVFALAVIEKYTVPYSRRNIAERRHNLSAPVRWAPRAPALAFSRH